jgi:glycerophosphoryl diester phosphodiesterase
MRYFLFSHLLLLLLILTGCNSADNPQTERKEMKEESDPYSEIDIQGHRGCRGLLPENTIPAFMKAVELGVNTLEMDVVISGDNKVVCSHEPWFSSEISLTPKGEEIPGNREKEHAIYQMDYKLVSQYDVGSKGNDRFPEQEKVKVAKPLLGEVIEQADSYAAELGRPLPWYNIETKTSPSGDGKFHPEPAGFCELLLDVLKDRGVADRSIIQSFDVRTLQYVHKKYPDIKLALLIANTSSPEENIEMLGFKPDVYSPDFHLINENLVNYCTEQKMLLIPWTLNMEEEFERALELGVDGIITDYHNKILAEAAVTH